MTDSKPWKLLLTEGSKRKEIQIQSSATLAELYQQVDSPSVQLARAFPRTDLPCCDTTTLLQAGIQPHERILVCPKVTQSTQSPTRVSKPKSKVTRTRKRKPQLEEAEQEDAYSDSDQVVSPTRRGGSQRAAAKAASASFSEVNRLIEEREKPSAKRTKVSTANSRRNNTPSTLRRNQHFAAASTTGRRLEDGAVLTASRPRRSKQQPQTDDPAATLLDAVNSRNTSKGARFMRSRWRQAVNDAFEQNKALSRMAALTGGMWDAVVEGDMLKVSFSKGVQGRGNFEEQVDGIAEEVLQSLVAGIHSVNPEALRPQNIALLSPRVFWSAAHHYSSSVESKRIDLGQALQFLQPDLDWSFLRRRKEQLSAKAIENRRQQQEQSGATAEADWQAAADAIESVEEAMGNLQAFERQSRNNQLANAAATRLVSAPYVVTTPSETDLDELKECVSESDATIAMAEHYATILLENGIHNWRELANWQVEDLEELLVAKTGNSIQTEVIQAWIDAAQSRSVDEIMVEICEGNVEAVQALLEFANSGTPKDLAAWRGIADELSNLLKGKVDASTSSELLERWCGRAQEALKQLEWLDEFVTPIGD